jgi:CRISPR-associated protein (TIGR02710 family)
MEAQVNGQQADEPQERPIFLICTVGGSPQPIATALRLLRPDMVWFLVSDGKNGQSSRVQVESPEIEYGRTKDETGREIKIPGPGLKFVEGCPARTEIIEVPADNPDGAYKACVSALKEAHRVYYPSHRLIADYTGGTKSMTGALLMAAFARPGVEVQFMAGVRSDLVKIESGSEKPQIMAADFILAERDFAAAEQAVEGYDYAAAVLLLNALEERLANIGTKPPESWRKLFHRARSWSEAMALWDAFNQKKAQSRLQGYPPLKDMLEATGHLRPLLALAGRPKGKPDWVTCADLWLNALRRGARGRYDDAVARLYRLVEATAQVHLWSRYGLKTGEIAPSEIPEEMRNSCRVNRNPKTGAEYVQLALNQTIELLRWRDPDDPLVLRVYADSDSGGGRLQGPQWLSKRNHSILAHGFTSIDVKAWEEARQWVDTNLTRFFADASFPQLPSVIPKP